MTTVARRKQSFKDFKIKFNETGIEELFKKYEDIGFIYPAKKKLLRPHFSQIKDNWKRLLRSKENLLWVLTNEDKEEEDFASVSVWKQSNYGLIAQHLVSDGNPFLSLKVMLAAQFKAEHEHSDKQVKSSQNWFRPDNRYAYRVFASMLDKLGPQKASLLLFQYLYLKLDQIAMPEKEKFIIKEVKGIDPKFIAFVDRQYGEVFLNGEELNDSDIRLSKIGSTFKKYGLKRSRKIFKIKDPQSRKILACIIANRAPVGLNFSFLENRAYYILDKNLDDQKRAQLISTMNTTIKPYYEDFELQAIPIVTDELSSNILQYQKATFLRSYYQSIWLRAGFPMWFNHIQSFLQRIENRLNNKKTA